MKCGKHYVVQTVRCPFCGFEEEEKSITFEILSKKKKGGSG